jgi:hypothetical protein
MKRILKKKKPAKILNAIRPIELPTPALEDPKKSREAAWSWWNEFEYGIKSIQVKGHSNDS